MAILVTDARIFKDQLFLREETAKRRIELQRDISSSKFVPPYLMNVLWEIEEVIDQGLRSDKFMRDWGAEVQILTDISDEMRKIIRRRYRGWMLDFQSSGPATGIVTTIKISPR